MVFTSPIFLFWFLPGFLLCYYALPARWRSGYLTLSSYIFYGWWRLDFVALMLASTVLDFFCGRGIGETNEQLDAGVPSESVRIGLNRRRKRYLLISICVNLGLLGYFKYWNFGVDSLNLALESLGYNGISWTQIVLPIGISFYTFQSLSYSIDIYRREAPRVKRFIDFACYISLFPQLVAGPIIRYQTLAKELSNRTHTWDKISRGIFLFQVGLAKKILLADSFATIADNAFRAESVTTHDAWLGTLAYTLQIYFDFSGYSDMAIGLGALLGFTFPVNFNSPYKSKSITEFWQRWHISLSTWLRDYLYVPLGGNRRGPRRTYINLMLTMLLGGLWHGAAVAFILWGAFQGSWLALERMLGKKPFYAMLPAPLRVATTFIIVMAGWVLFRATDLAQISDFYSAMAGFSASDSTRVLRAELTTGQLGLFVLAIGMVFFMPNSQELAEYKRGIPRLIAAGAFAVSVCQMFVVTYSPFLYFRF